MHESEGVFAEERDQEASSIGLALLQNGLLSKIATGFCGGGCCFSACSAPQQKEGRSLYSAWNEPENIALPLKILQRSAFVLNCDDAGWEVLVAKPLGLRSTGCLIDQKIAKA